jgi:hypothetical protein
MKDITTGAPANRAEVLYEVEFNAVELDLLYELRGKLATLYQILMTLQSRGAGQLPSSR